MPFTGSHPAIITPLLKSRILSVSGLIMGSMVPDFEFFIRLEAEVIHGHSILPMFWLNVPTAILTITLYHLIVRNQLILHLPPFFRSRFTPFLTFNWLVYLKLNYFKIIVSILIGNISHLVWDSFTHKNGFFVELLPLMKYTYFQIPLFHILQYAFSLFGAWAIIHFISKMKRFTVKTQTTKIEFSVYWLLVIVTTIALYFFRYDAADYSTFTNRIVFLCAGFLLGLLISSSLFILNKPENKVTKLTRNFLK
ncbi:DUF4184 family protein [Maribacter algarum]|uniref:DUF4184 family protein n=1 Tax=Maribacter algarum (ex Zhang et al. 2020) TaxID=2578118 RepID=A0A5S3PUV4_9FLAO|nr:DUF4184 family protein [Maribacter algarum]TMM58698.1 DUF4184 family protein [Maribacter algarum]